MRGFFLPGPRLRGIDPGDSGAADAVVIAPRIAAGP